MDKKEKFLSYIEEIKQKGLTHLERETNYWPAEIITNLAMELFEKETKERIDKLLKRKDNVIKFDRSSKPPVDSL